MSYTKFSKEVTKWLKDNGLPCYGTANDSPEKTKARLDAWMRGSKEILRQWITEKRYRELISCAHGGWYQDDVIFEPLAEHFVANHLFDELRFLCERGIRFSAEDMLSTIQSEKEEHGSLDMRGQVFDFGGLTWFTMGGAASHDIQDGILDPADPDFEHRYWLMRRMRSMFRVKGVSWWAEEMPSQAEYQEALANLERVNWTVDCVLTHCAPSGVVQKINPSYGTDELTDFLEMVSQRCKFAYWFFGHYHENRIIDQKYILQWEKISELGF